MGFRLHARRLPVAVQDGGDADVFKNADAAALLGAGHQRIGRVGGPDATVAWEPDPTAQLGHIHPALSRVWVREPFHDLVHGEHLGIDPER